MTDTFGKWIAIAVGTFTLVGTVLGAGISYGQHMKADTEQDRRLHEAESLLDDVNRRVYKLEWAHDANHPDDGPLHEANQGVK